MGDKRFDDRLKRIAARQNGRPTAELIAGVGDIRQAKEEAKAKKSVSLLWMIIGSTLGFAAFFVLRDLVGLDVLQTVTPETALPILQSHPLVFFAAGLVPLMVLMLFLSFLRGRRAVGMMSLTGAFVGAAIGGVYAAL